MKKLLEVDKLSPALKAKYMKWPKGLNVTKSMIETAFGEGEDKDMEKALKLARGCLF